MRSESSVSMSDIQRLLCQFTSRLCIFLRCKLQQWKTASLGRKATNASGEGQWFTWQPVCGDVDVPPSSKEQLVC